MVVAIINMELVMPAGCDLRDKRARARSVSDRARRQLNISIMETGNQNSSAYIEFTAAMVGIHRDQLLHALEQLRNICYSSGVDISVCETAWL